MSIPTIAQLQASWAYSPASGTITFPIPLVPSTPENKASLELGFPAITMSPNPETGLPPKGQDMNGILNQLSQLAVAYSVGMGFVYNATLYNNTNPYITGYPAGARVKRTDNQGYWLNLVDNNQTDPEDLTLGTNWAPDAVYGFYQYTIASALTTLVTLGVVNAGMTAIYIDESTGAGSDVTFVLPPTFFKSYYIKNATAARSLLFRTSTPSNIITIPPGGETIIYVYSATLISSLQSSFSPAPAIGPSVNWVSGSGTQIQFAVGPTITTLPMTRLGGQMWINGANQFVVPWTGMFMGSFIIDFDSTTPPMGIFYGVLRNGSQYLAFDQFNSIVNEHIQKTVVFLAPLMAGDLITAFAYESTAGTTYATVIQTYIIAVAN